MTMREFFRELVADDEKRTEERHTNLSLAWHIEALHRQKELPKLDTLLRKNKASEPQSIQEMKAQLHMISQTYGIPLRKRTVAHG